MQELKKILISITSIFFNQLEWIFYFFFIVYIYYIHTYIYTLTVIYSRYISYQHSAWRNFVLRNYGIQIHLFPISSSASLPFLLHLQSMGRGRQKGHGCHVDCEVTSTAAA